MFELIGMLVFGGVIGALARLVMKGEQDLSIVWTIILGAIGAFLGGSIAGLLGVAQTPGIDLHRYPFGSCQGVAVRGAVRRPDEPAPRYGPSHPPQRRREA